MFSPPLSPALSFTSSPPLSGLSSGVSGAPSGEAEGGGGAESRHDHPGSRHGLRGQVQLNIKHLLPNCLMFLQSFIDCVVY